MRSKPDLGWCHMQLLHAWQTVSTPQHGALWSACQTDGQVNDTNENQPSLPLEAKHWVTASKQPKSVCEPESNWFYSLFLFFCSSRPSFSFLLAPLLPLFGSLWSSQHLFRNLSLSFSLAVFLHHWRPLFFFHCLPSSPVFLPVTLSVTSLCCFLSLCHQALRGRLTASPVKTGRKTAKKESK